MNTAENIKKQKFLGKKGMVLFITLMNMFIPLSTDLYLPALPTMSTHFDASASLVNLTLVSFFFFFAVGTILLGPLCDKYGRRKVLLISSAMYTLASASCALSPNVYVMIAARVFQGISAGGIISARLPRCLSRIASLAVSVRRSSLLCSRRLVWRQCLRRCWARCFCRSQTGAALLKC